MLVMRRAGAAGTAIAGLAISALACSSSALQTPAPIDSGVVDAGAGGGSGTGVGGSGAGGSGSGGNHAGVGGSDGVDSGGAGGGGAGAGGADGGPDTGGDQVDAGPLVGSGIALFDSTTEGFAFDTYDEPANLAAPTNPSAPPPTLLFDASQGSPSSGSLQVSAPFSRANQYVSLVKYTNVSAPLDWSGMTLHVRVKVSQGTFKGLIEPYVFTGSIYVFGGTARQVGTSSEWQDFTMNLTDPVTRNPGYNPAQVVAYGVFITTGAAGAGSTAVVFNIDSFTLSPGPLVDGGSSDATASDGSDDASD